jgi:hypothetical protein
MVRELLARDGSRGEVLEVLEGVLDSQKEEEAEEQAEETITLKKKMLFANLLSFVGATFNHNIEQQMFRFLKNAYSLRVPLHQSSNTFNYCKAKLVNSYLRFFRSAIIHNHQFSQTLFQQYLKLVAGMLHIGPSESSNERI